MLSGIPAEGMERLILNQMLTLQIRGVIMKVTFKPAQFRVSEDAGNISVEGSFRGLGIDFLAVMARLYQLPCLWFSEGIFIELDFDSEKLILKAPMNIGEDFCAGEVVQEIPLSELVCSSVEILREKYIKPFAANLAEFNFGMPKTAQAIRQRWHPARISKIAAREGHPVLDAEITNLLFRENWELATSYERAASAI